MGSESEQSQSSIMDLSDRDDSSQENYPRVTNKRQLLSHEPNEVKNKNFIDELKNKFRDILHSAFGAERSDYLLNRTYHLLKIIEIAY